MIPVYIFILRKGSFYVQTYLVKPLFIFLRNLQGRDILSKIMSRGVFTVLKDI